MKLLIVSDARMATDPNVPGHGLGQMVYTVAKGLADCGHTVTLLAFAGSKFDAGKLVMATDEREFLQHDMTQYDAVMDNSHAHVTSAIKGLPAIQVSHDRESQPTTNAVYPSNFHRAFHGGRGKVVHNGVHVPVQPEKRASTPYFAYLSTFYPPKGALLAYEAARLAGVRIVFAGTTPPAPPPGAEYLGPLWGVDKMNFLAGATALVFPPANEAGPMTVLEAQAVGCPVIVSAYGGAHENMDDGVTGYTAKDTLGFVEAIKNIGAIDRAACIQWVRENRSAEKMIDGYEKLLAEVSAGETW